ncbi:hypothetical protein M9Y10_025304 [Tritrichomonas musculus]|uniref:Uncharacterized protein n=1 Tax=Tritrichomonas musculus TaxID=1915356 RepID=A0ABR2HB21_9EUKA
MFNFRDCINKIVNHVQFAHQIAMIQINNGQNPLDPFNSYIHFVVQGLKDRQPDLAPMDALKSAKAIANRRIDAEIYSQDEETKKWARNLKIFRDDDRRLFETNPQKKSKIGDLIILENYSIELHDKIVFHKNQTFEQKFKNVFGCSDNQKKRRIENQLYALRSLLGFL